MNWIKFYYSLGISAFGVLGYAFSITTKMSNENPFKAWADINFYLLSFLMVFILTYCIYKRETITDLIPNTQQNQIGESN